MMLVKGTVQSSVRQCKIKGQFKLKEEKAILNKREHLEPKRNWAMLL